VKLNSAYEPELHDDSELHDYSVSLLCNDILPSAGTLGLLVYTTTTKIYKHLLIILIDIPFMIFLLITRSCRGQ
jgi:hypothetical protein